MIDYNKMSDFKINKLVLTKFYNRSPLHYSHNADGRSVGYRDSIDEYHWFDFCNNAKDAWPIIEEIWWDLFAVDDIGVVRWNTEDTGKLRAAMIIYLKTES